MNPKFPLYYQIYEDLKQKINAGEYRIGTQLPIEHDLIAQYRVSRITIRQALQLLADEHLIKPEPGKGTFVLKKSPTKKTQKMIGLILPGLLDSFGNRLLQAIEQEATNRGYLLIVRFSHGEQITEQKAIDELLALPVDGLILEPSQVTAQNSALSARIMAGDPILIVDKELTGIRSLFVSTDHAAGALAVARYLADRGQKTVRVLTYLQISNATLEKRQNAFQQIFGSNCIQPLITTTQVNWDEPDHSEQDIDRIKQLILEQKPSCLVGLDSHLASLIIQAIWELQLVVPRDISIFGFDSGANYRFNNYSYLAQDEWQIGKQSVDLLVEKIDNGHVTQSRILIPAKIIEHESIAKNIDSDGLSIEKNMYF
ncbi:GntR family transcriptional regulator [Lapidilactobacillus mulanensis]|nr:GntR family transcriptional regulator [Lapidilactobacillus mulanensis]